MEAIVALLGVAKELPGAIKAAQSAKDWLVNALAGLFAKSAGSTKPPVIPRGKLTHFIHQLGLATVADVDRVLATWPTPAGFDEERREELAVVLKKLVQGARFHTTHGTKLNNYVTAGDLLDQLLSEVEPKLHQGDELNGWVLTKYLGMGGFGEVWLAANDDHHASHVYKFFTRDGSADWVKQEAKALKSLWKKLDEVDCQNVIDYLNVNLSAQPYPYLVLEYAELGTLEDWILTKPDHRRAKVGVDELMWGIARGVAAAHKHGIHHRDLKPANILLAGEPDDVTPKIADFGLSVDTAPANQAYSSQAVLVGTSMYLPPEASNPTCPRDYAQDDVFALGVIWFQLLTGELTRPSYDFADQLSAAGADSRTVKMISRCLAHPDRRYPSAGELFADLDADVPPGPGEWAVPAGGFDVAGIAREYLERVLR